MDSFFLLDFCDERCLILVLLSSVLVLRREFCVLLLSEMECSDADSLNCCIAAKMASSAVMFEVSDEEALPMVTTTTTVCD